MQHFDFSFRILYFSNWIIVFSFTTCLNPCKNHCSSKWHDMFVSWPNNHAYKCTHDYSEICQVLSEQVHSQYFSGCKSISMEVFALDHLKKLKPSTVSMAQLHFNLYNERDQDAISTAKHIFVLFFNLFFTKHYIYILDNHVVSHVWWHKSLSLYVRYLSTIMSCFRNYYYYWLRSRST